MYNLKWFVSKVNQTKQDWQLIASVEGEGFYGPPVMVAKACLTSYYPLMFRPTAEDCVKVMLPQSVVFEVVLCTILLTYFVSVGKTDFGECFRWQ